MPPEDSVPLLSLVMAESEPSPGPRCAVCRDLEYLSVKEGGGVGELKEEMAKCNITEAKPMDPTKPEHNQEWPADEKPRYPAIPEYKESAQRGCRCCAFVYLLYSAAVQLIMKFGFTTVNGWGMGAVDKDIHAFAVRIHGTLRLRLTNVKWPTRVGRDLDWDVYTVGDIPTPIPFLRPASPIASMAMQAMDQVRGWLKDCRANHPKCRVKREGFMPRRLVQIIAKDISTVPCNPLVNVQFSDIPTLKLVEPGEPVPYVALSYCWGTNRHHWVTTTRSTIESHRRGMVAWRMPRTIAEAIQITRLLGFEYIWIDAVCIVQDDPEDWMFEAARMGNVYSTAELVLSANATNDCTRPTAGFQNFGLAYESCFALNGSFAPLMPGAGWDDGLGDPAFPSPERFTAQDAIILRMAHLHSLMSGPGGYQPLNTRGWTCQESLLGRRMLSLTGCECVWTCDESAFCECGFNQIVLENQLPDAKKGQMWESMISHRPVQRLRRACVEGRITDDLPCLDTIHNTWRQLVSDYSQREITVESDKMVAISGLARIFGKVFSMLSGPQDWNDTTPAYLAGVWRNNIHQDLLWLAQRFPQQLTTTLDLGGSDGESAATAYPTQQQQDIADEPFASAAARLKWLTERPARPTKYRAPSWSWASSNFCVLWLLDMIKWQIEGRGGEHSTSTTPYVELIKGHIDAKPDEYGTVTAGSITVRGPLVQVRRQRVPLSAKDKEYIATLNFQASPLIETATVDSRAAAAQAISQTDGKAHHAFVRSPGGLVFDYHPDDEFEPNPVTRQETYNCLFDSWQKPCQKDDCDCQRGWSDEAFWCLRINRVAVREASRPTQIQEGWLVLRRLDRRDAYERVGVGHFLKLGSEARDFRLFEDAVETVLRIV